MDYHRLPSDSKIIKRNQKKGNEVKPTKDDYVEIQ